MWGRETRRLEGAEGEIRLGRDDAGVARIQAANDLDLALGLGWCHARDRQVQMMLVRLIGQGRLGECLQASEESLGIDTYARRNGFAAASRDEVDGLDPETRAWLEAYAEGVNRYLSTHARPMEFLLAGYRPEPWRPADTLLTVRVMAFVGLAEGQQDAEKWLVQALRRGADPEVLRRLFAPHLDGMDDEILALVQDLAEVEPLVPPEVRGAAALPRLRASNNWAVAGSRSASGMPIQANDPHLEGNRLPAIWYELDGELPDDVRVGATMPGLPGLIMGRNSRISAGFTYGFMDMIDYFVEDVVDGEARGPEGREPLVVRREEIRRRGNDPVVLEVYETPRGILEGYAGEDGLYLSRAWSSYRHGAARSAAALRAFQGATSTEEAARAVRGVGVSCNWVIADVDGHIAYQQSGHLPGRRHSGLHPVPAWHADLAWGEDVDPADLAVTIDPPEGLLVTANGHHQAEGGPVAVNLHMGDYRARRIRARLEEAGTCTVETMQSIQGDLYSLQAEEFMELLAPLLPDTEAGRRLAAWDRTYPVESEEALWFEEIYSRLLRETFAPFLGEAAWAFTEAETAVLVDFHWFFDRAFLGGDDCWFPRESREELSARVAAEVLASPPAGTWGDRNQFVMKNLFFGGRMPSWAGFDVGPVPIPGCRATPSQGQVFRAKGRETSFLPTWRYVADLAEPGARTALAGGPSDRRFSRWYASGVPGWRDFRYKALGASE
jgi:penicillin amidase